jgi:Spy/CpxP family protein refolding chaperone
MMKRTLTVRNIVALSLLAATGLVTAAENAPDNQPATGKHAPYKRFDPVQHTQHRLDKLEAKLNLKDNQKSAWQVYADAALARARERTGKMQELHSRRGEPPKELDTAAKLDKAAEFMRSRADELQKVAQDTRSFQQVLTPEQQTIFDRYWKSQQRRGKMGGHRPA